MARVSGVLALGLLLLAGAPATSFAGAFVDPLDLPAPSASQAAHRPLRAIARAGQRLVAVGILGRIVVSDDDGKTWQQARVPASADLNAVTFVDALHGWAVGHDGLILTTRDGGSTWSVQVDGRRLEQLITGHYSALAHAGNAQAAKLLEQLPNMMQPGVASFFMDVAFEDEKRGFAVGKFGLILATQDGGKTWEPSNDHIDNPRFLHLTAIRRIAGTTWIVGEEGSVWKLNPQSQNFELTHVGYNGTLFGIAGDGDFVLVFGMRGNAFRSADGGGHWEKVGTGIAGGITCATVLSDRNVVLAAQSGELAVSHDAARTFEPLTGERPTMYAGALGLGSGEVMLAGLNGVQIQKSNSSNGAQLNRTGTK
ncbi:WD40/YVTN/BNR-like repeat-containing protein [Paraburkholderia sp. HP33-1]|uniref:WD40/YVTN/BNR-like repeat-containing protein n=1 Tax=Paraburkholderia sp. HP33-1 TaxID=2883243 RepID=UPI001F2D245E|nr:YCF48-related protein [Paraburkholderia sp. HP33-1]